MVINGKEISAGILSSLKKQPKPKKYLAAVLIGENPASISFLKQKERIAEELGVEFKLTSLQENSAENIIIETISNLGQDSECGGIILQLPLPTGLNRRKIINEIPKKKDVDALNGGDVLPPAVGVVEKILGLQNIELSSVAVAVIGLGALVGAPVSEWLKGKVRELILIDEKDDINAVKNADVVISGVGKPGMITPEILKENALVIDFGYGMKNGKLSGDFDSSLLTPNSLVPNAYTPVPGGTGPILVAQLFENFYKLCS